MLRGLRREVRVGQGLGFRALCLGCRVLCLGFRILCLGFRVEALALILVFVPKAS